jgi:integrase
MVEDLFQTAKHRSLQRNAPLLIEREQFLSHMSDCGTSKKELRRTASLLVNLVRFMELDQMRRIQPAEIERAGHLWLTSLDTHLTRSPGPTSLTAFVQMALRWFRFHEALDSPDAVPVDAFAGCAAEFFRDQAPRGLSPRTIETQKSALSIFFDWARSCDIELSMVTLKEISEYFEIKRRAGWTIHSIAGQSATLRGYFRHAEAMGWTKLKISRGIISPRVPRYSRALQGPRWRDVRRLLSANHHMTLRETRTRAVLHLCAIYALRVGEVVNLTIDDFDWTNEIFTVVA